MEAEFFEEAVDGLDEAGKVVVVWRMVFRLGGLGVGFWGLRGAGDLRDTGGGGLCGRGFL